MCNIIDFHSHILPGIDDGSASVEESIEMLKIEAQQGITHVIATPHFYARHDSPRRFLERRAEAEWILRQEMKKHPGLPQLSVGTEVYFFPGISDSEILKEFAIDQKRCVLLEMPVSVWTDAMYREIASIPVKQGLIPIIAHVDRYIGPFRTRRILQKLEKLPALVQANASFFLHSSTRRMALKMLEREQIHILGSDCHNLISRVPNLEAAIQIIVEYLGDGAIDRIVSYQDMLLLDE